jgi:hypothetical protein
MFDLEQFAADCRVALREKAAHAAVREVVARAVARRQRQSRSRRRQGHLREGRASARPRHHSFGHQSHPLFDRRCMSTAAISLRGAARSGTRKRFVSRIATTKKCRMVKKLKRVEMA